MDNSEGQKNQEKERTEKQKEKSFTKEAYLKSKEYKPHRDLLNTLLKSGVKYTKKEVEKIIEGYLKKEVV